MPPKLRSTNTRRLNELLSTSQNKSYFVGAVTVVFIVVMAFVGILPAYSAFTFQNEENGKRDQLIDSLTKKLTTSQSLSKEYDQKSSLVTYFKEVFPDVANQDEIISLLNNIATSNSTYLSKISFNKNPSTTFIQSGYDASINSQQVNITVEGSQSSLLSLIKDVEASRRILNVASLTLDRKPQEETGNVHGDYILNLAMEYYFYSKLDTTN